MRFDDPRIEWRINDVERKADQANNRLHELDSLRSSLDSLEHSNRELGSRVDGLRYDLQTCLEEIDRLKTSLEDRE